MKRALKRIAAVAVALPLAVGLSAGTAQANHSVTVPGCFGVAIVVCNLTVSVGLPAGIETYQTTVPVCAGTCTYVPVTLARTTPGEPTNVCYSYNSLGGPTVTSCYDGSTIDPWIDYVDGVVTEVGTTVGRLVTEVETIVVRTLENLERLPYTTCVAVARVLARYDIEVYC